MKPLATSTTLVARSIGCLGAVTRRLSTAPNREAEFVKLQVFFWGPQKNQTEKESRNSGGPLVGLSVGRVELY